uniref:Progestin and adipoQ receptor family member Va n=1 Tax=Cyprinus carpio TaxID=7962 RepID=A0A8C2L1Z1_CYPCA
MSERARHICFFFDYGALSFYSLGVPSPTFLTHFQINGLIYCSPSAHLAVFTGSLFATHLPERLAPGSFEYIVNSKLWFFNASFTCQNHQLFHVFGITGTHFQMTAIDLDMAAPKQWLHAHLLPVTLSNTAGAAFFISLFIPVYRLWLKPESVTRISGGA